MSKKFRIHEFAERVGRSPSTIRRWEREGKISPKRHPSGHRCFDESDVRHILAGGRPMKRKVVVYRIMRGEVAKVVVAHKDRLVRFGFECFVHIAEENGCEIEVVNQESLSPQQEMVEDLISIVHTFSCRLYGLRKYETKLKEDFPATKPVRSERVQ